MTTAVTVLPMLISWVANHRKHHAFALERAGLVWDVVRIPPARQRSKAA